MQTMLNKNVSTSRMARSGRPSRCSSVRVCARAGNWLPGSDAPAWLPDSAAGNYGFDPLGLSRDTGVFNRLQEAELIHCRWAMLGAAGVLAVELFGFGDWYTAANWVPQGGRPTWFGVTVPFDINTLVGVEFVLFAVSEGLRNDNTDANRRLYPGGAFDPLGFAKDTKKFEEYKLKEIKNGRLAMLATAGFVAQHAANGKTVLGALGDHLASPWSQNFATNGVSLPF